MKRYRPLIVALAVLIAGCSYQYQLRAVEKDGKVLIEPADDQGHGCLSDLQVTSETGEIVWQLSAGRYRHGEPGCENNFPVVYGVAPPGLPEKTTAKPLEEGVVYMVEAWDGDSYSGAFRLRRRIVVENVNVPPGSFPNALEQPMEQPAQ